MWLGAFPFPVEFTPFGWEVTAANIAKLGGAPKLRYVNNEIFVTNNANYILDCKFPEIKNPEKLHHTLKSFTGVVETGLFINMADQIIAAKHDGVEILTKWMKEGVFMNLGTIGTSWITSAFIDAAKEQGSLRLQAVYSRTEQSAKEFAEKHGAAGYFTELEEMAKSDSIDCVYIASPNSLHFEQVLFLLKHKKHVICEKPIFSTQMELKRAFQTAEENDVYLFEAIRNIHMPKFQALKESLGSCGKLRSAVLNYSKYSSRYNNVLNGEEPNIFSLSFSGGALVDLGVYPLAAAIVLFGKPSQTVYSPVKISTGVDGSGTLVLGYPNFTCTILCSKITTSYNPSEIHGENGTFIIDDMGSFANVSLKNIHTSEESVIGEDHGHHDMFYEIEEFVKIIETNDREKYEVLQKVSADVLEVTEKVRKENGIIFTADN